MLVCFPFFLIKAAQPSGPLAESCQRWKTSSPVLTSKSPSASFLRSRLNSKGNVGQDPLRPKLLCPSRRAVGFPRGCFCTLLTLGGDTWDLGWPGSRIVGKGWSPSLGTSWPHGPPLSDLCEPAVCPGSSESSSVCPEKRPFAIGLLRVPPSGQEPGAERRKVFLMAQSDPLQPPGPVRPHLSHESAASHVAAPLSPPSWRPPHSAALRPVRLKLAPLAK